MYTPDVPHELLDLSASLGLFTEMVQTEYVEASEVFFDHPHKHQRFGKIFTKWRALELERYDKVLFLDADLFVRANLDCLFELDPPAAMARGPNKPKHGKQLPGGVPVNAGVMLLRPNAEFFRTLLEEVSGPNPRRLKSYNSPDSDYLTEHPRLHCEWRSIGLDFNYQLEFDRLDASERTVRFSNLIEAHFSEEGATMPWETVKIVHFSGMKPWTQLIQDASSLLDVKVVDGKQPSLDLKLVAGINEYAQEVATFQAICSQLGLGEGILWHNTNQNRAVLQLPCEKVRAYLHSMLPQGGRWFERDQPSGTAWIPPGQGVRPMEDVGCPTAVLAFLEVFESSDDDLRVGDRVSATVGGETGIFQVTKLVADKRAELMRQDAANEDLNPDSCGDSSQLDFSAPPRAWDAWKDEAKSGEAQRPWGHDSNNGVGDAGWPRSDKDVIELPVDDVELLPGALRGWKPDRTEVVVWRRGFALGRNTGASEMLEALKKLVDEAKSH